jgi:hypothetical protein
MPFGFGSRSAQTPSESSADSNTDKAGRRIAGELDGINPDDPYKVYHKWRKTGGKPRRGMPHHSQIFVTTFLDNKPVLNFGLFQDDGQVVFLQEDSEDPANPYHVSSSYKPNPVIVRGDQIEDAFNFTCQQCGPKYKLLHNNCQKFGRILMTFLGASHDRELFHP